MTPIEIVKNAEANPTRSATRLPQISWLKMSRPRASVPRTYVFPLAYPLRHALASASKYSWAQLGGRGARYWPEVLYEYTSPRYVPNQTASRTWFGSLHATGIALIPYGNVFFHVREPEACPKTYKMPMSSAGLAVPLL